MEGEPPRPAEALAVMQGLNRLAALQVLSSVETGVPAAALGLAPPQARLEFDLTDGRRVTLSVGATTPYAPDPPPDAPPAP